MLSFTKLLGEVLFHKLSCQGVYFYFIFSLSLSLEIMFISEKNENLVETNTTAIHETAVDVKKK